LSQELYVQLRERANLGGLGWPAGLGVSVVFHGLVVAAILFTPKTEPPAPETKVTWVTLPSAGNAGASGGSEATEVGRSGERLRRVEEVAPKREEPSGYAPATPNVFGNKVTKPIQGTSKDTESMGKAPVAAKGKTASPNSATGAAGSGGGGGIGAGTGIPGLRASAGVQGGTGLIDGLDGDFPFTWYLQQVQTRITGNWNRLSAANGRVQIYFRIRRDGGIEGVRVDSPSGNASLDQSALLAVRRSDPLPRLPEGFEAQALGVRFWFTYLGN
jgi:protein TonB